MKKFIAAALLLLALPGCSGLSQPTPTPVPTNTSTLFPTVTSAPLLPTETPDLVSQLAPQGEPVSEWKGIPIMPDAIAGEGDDESYVFTVRATTQQVQEYYERELGKLGWELSSRGAGSNSSLMLVFVDSTLETIMVSIIVKGEECLVVLVK